MNPKTQTRASGMRVRKEKCRERGDEREKAEFAVNRMVELFPSRRSNRPRSIPGGLPCFERMESWACRLRSDLRRLGIRRDANSGGRGDRRCSSQARIAGGEPRRIGCRSVSADGASQPVESVFRTIPYRCLRAISSSNSCRHYARNCRRRGLCQFGRNQAFNSAGNVFTALLVAYVSYKFGYRAIFVVAAILAIPAALSLLLVDGKQIDYARARGSIQKEGRSKAEAFSALLKDRILLYFLATAFLFHLANAAMLPQLGEMLSKDNLKAAAPFMSACIIVTQLVIAITAAWIGKRAAAKGRKPLLLLGFGVLPIRGVLYTLTHYVAALIAIQTLDGVANAIFGIVSILVIKDRTQGTGRFNVAAGSLATMVGIGAALSMTIGGQLIQHIGYRASFLGLAGIALLAFALLWFAVPETLSKTDG